MLIRMIIKIEPITAAETVYCMFFDLNVEVISTDLVGSKVDSVSGAASAWTECVTTLVDVAASPANIVNVSVPISEALKRPMTRESVQHGF